MQNPLLLRSSWVSDHVPVWVKISRKERMHSGNRPVPSHTFKSPVFRVEHDKLARYTNLEKLTPFARLQLHKLILKEAVRRARNAELLKVDHAGLNSPFDLASVASPTTS